MGGNLKIGGHSLHRGSYEALAGAAALAAAPWAIPEIGSALGLSGGATVAGDAVLPGALAGTEGLGGAATGIGDAILPGALQGTEGLAGTAGGLLSPTADALAMGQNGLTPAGINAGPQQQGLLGSIKSIANSPFVQGAQKGLSIANSAGSTLNPQQAPMQQFRPPISPNGQGQQQTQQAIQALATAAPSAQLASAGGGQAMDPKILALLQMLMQQQGTRNG